MLDILEFKIFHTSDITVRRDWLRHCADGIFNPIPLVLRASTGIDRRALKANKAGYKPNGVYVWEWGLNLYRSIETFIGYCRVHTAWGLAWHPINTINPIPLSMIWIILAKWPWHVGYRYRSQYLSNILVLLWLSV